MMSNRQAIELRNYLSDRRVIAAERTRTLHSGDERKMTVCFDRAIEDDERDLPEVRALGDVDEITITLPAKFEVCDLCDGRGVHVSPSIDADGISSDDEFWEDDGDEDEYYDDDGEVVVERTSRYARGDYDVPCAECGGKRVVLVVDRDAADPKELERLDRIIDEDDEFDMISRSERMAGA